MDTTGTTSSFEFQPIALLDGPLSFQFNSIAENPFSSSGDHDNQREDTGGPNSDSDGSDADSDISDDEFNFAKR